MMKIRAEMGKDNILLQGIVEADETYIGGKGKKNSDKETGEPCKRGRGTAKDVVLGAVARGGKVVAALVENASCVEAESFIKVLNRARIVSECCRCMPLADFRET